MFHSCTKTKAIQETVIRVCTTLCLISDYQTFEVLSKYFLTYFSLGVMSVGKLIPAKEHLFDRI